MNRDSNNHDKSGFWNWGTGLTVVIVLFVVATLSVVFYLVSLDYYMVSENHYEEAVKYEQQIQRIEHTRALEGAISIKQVKSNEIKIDFPDTLAQLQPVGIVKLYRPSDSRLDQSFKLSIDESGSQLIPATDLKKGKWLVRILWEVGEKGFFKETAIFI